MLVAMIAMIREAGTTEIPVLLNYDFPPQMQTWLWLAFFASMAVKMPMWPVHTWLPDAHVQAPTAGSMILAGEIGRAHVCTPVTNAHLVCRLLLEKKKQQ